MWDVLKVLYTRESDDSLRSCNVFIHVNISIQLKLSFVMMTTRIYIASVPMFFLLLVFPETIATKPLNDE